MEQEKTRGATRQRREEQEEWRQTNITKDKGATDNGNKKTLEKLVSLADIKELRDRDAHIAATRTSSCWCLVHKRTVLLFRAFWCPKRQTTFKWLPKGMALLHYWRTHRQSNTCAFLNLKNMSQSPQLDCAWLCLCKQGLRWTKRSWSRSLSWHRASAAHHLPPEIPTVLGAEDGNPVGGKLRCSSGW